MKNHIIAIAIMSGVAAGFASAASDPVEVHKGFVDHLKTVRNHLVPAPLIDFVESFPPIAIPRAQILRLAQGPGQPPVAVVDTTVAAQDPGPDNGPIDPSGIASWAQGVALSTTQHALDGMFPRPASQRRPIIVGGEAKNATGLEEDLTVMMRILEKSAGGKGDGQATASGIALFTFSQPSSPRVFYLEGYGPMFVLNVRYPLVAPPKRDEQGRTNETNSEWERAREEVYGRRGPLDELKLNGGPAEEFDAARVERLKTQIISDLANAKNIRNLKSDDSVTVVVLGGGGRGSGVVTHQTRAPSGVSSAGHGGAYLEMRETRGSAGEGAQSTMTLRAKKSDIDAFAKGKLSEEEFQKKVSVQAN